MASSGRLGKGTQIYIADAGGTVYSRIAQLMDVAMPGYKSAKVEITNQDSPNRMKEYISGLRDGTEMELEYLWTPAIMAILNALDGYTRNIRVVYPAADGTEPSASTDVPRHDFQAVIQDTTEGDAPVEGKMTGKFKLVVTSLPVLTAS